MPVIRYDSMWATITSRTHTLFLYDDDDDDDDDDVDDEKNH